MYKAYILTYPHMEDNEHRYELKKQLFFDLASTLPELGLIKADLSLEAGCAGTFSFTVGSDNITRQVGSDVVWTCYGSYVEVFKGDDSIFFGRVYSIKTDTNMNYQIECEGALAFFNDYYVRAEKRTYTSLYELVYALVQRYDLTMAYDKRIRVLPNYIHVSAPSSIPFETSGGTLFSILNELVDAYGGYITIIREENQTAYGVLGLALVWYDEDSAPHATQTIEFGENLVSVEQEVISDDIFSIVIPLGGRLEDSDERVTIASVNQGRDYLVDISAAQVYGRVEQTVEFDEITDPNALLNAGLDYLDQIPWPVAPPISVHIKAVDLSLTDISGAIEAFRVGEKVTVRSTYHGIDGSDFMVESIKANLLNPAQNSLEVGHKRVGYIGLTSKSISKGYKGAAYRKVNLLETVAFADGVIDTETGAKENSSTYSCCEAFVEVDTDNVLYVSVNEGYKCVLSGYTNNQQNAYAESTDPISGLLSIGEPYKYYRISYATDPESSSPSSTTNPPALSIYQYRR